MERGDNPEDFRDDLIQSGHIGMINGLKKADIHQPD
jgi:DNA-directed RNA polymerase specialized sigma subunit